MERFKSGLRSFWNNLFEAAGSIIVAITVILFDLAGFLNGGLLHLAVLSGVALVLSILFCVAGLRRKHQKTFFSVMARHGFWFDIVCTVVLTVVGFGMGATLGLVCMFIGLNISLMTSTIRLYMAMTDRSYRSEFFGTENDKTPTRYRRTERNWTTATKPIAFAAA